MVNVLVVFGSKSDSKVFHPIVKGLEKNGISVDLRICSAHRTPDELDFILGNPYDLIIAGAGLSAALPGVVASKVLCPVVGVPCHGNYEGLDALLSVVQMPPGIPVLAVGVENVDAVVINSINILNLKNKSEVIIVTDDKDNERVKKAIHMLDNFSVKYDFSDGIKKDALNLVFAYFDEIKEKSDELVIYCPLMLKDDDKAEAALNLLKHSSHGLWVGLNRGENAAIAAVEILGTKEAELMVYREAMKKKVLDADKNVNK